MLYGKKHDSGVESQSHKDYIGSVTTKTFANTEEQILKTNDILYCI